MQHPDPPAVQLPLIRPDMDTTERGGSVFLLGRLLPVLVLLLMAISGFMTLGVVLLVMGFFVVPGWVRRLPRDHVRRRDIIGEVVVHSGGVDVVHGAQCRSIGWAGARAIRLDTNHILRRGYNGRDILRNGIATLSVEFAHGTEVVKFLVRTKQDQQQLIAVVRTWYHQGLPLPLENLTRLMGVGLHFQGIQELKRELGLH